jgi:hypothetical protein
LYCPATPVALFGLGPLNRSASKDQAALHDEQAAELERYRLGQITKQDGDGYYRVICPAAAGKVRCTAKSKSMALGYDRPEIVSVPEDLPACCSQATITVSPNVNQNRAFARCAWSESDRGWFLRVQRANRASLPVSSFYDHTINDAHSDPAWTDVEGNRPVANVLPLKMRFFNPEFRIPHADLSSSQRMLRSIP